MSDNQGSIDVRSNFPSRSTDVVVVVENDSRYQVKSYLYPRVPPTACSDYQLSPAGWLFTNSIAEVLVVDDAGVIAEAEVLSCIFRQTRLIFTFDHKQIPPFV